MQVLASKVLPYSLFPPQSLGLAFISPFLCLNGVTHLWNCRLPVNPGARSDMAKQIYRQLRHNPSKISSRVCFDEIRVSVIAHTGSNPLLDWEHAKCTVQVAMAGTLISSKHTPMTAGL